MSLFNLVSAWLSRQKPPVLAGIALGYTLVAAIILAGIQAIVPDWDNPWNTLAEIVLGLLEIVVIVVCLRHAWVATDNAEKSDQRKKRAWLLAILIVSLLFQLGHWYAKGGSLSAETGDDDEIYILLAHQITGQIDGPPIFTFRPPGLPLLIAGTLGVFGSANLWTFSLVQCLLLATIPALLFLILWDWLPGPFAALGSILFLFTTINEHDPFVALSELAYTVGTVMSLVTIVIGLKKKGFVRVLWIGAAAVALAAKTLIRPTGLVGAVSLALAVFLIAEDLEIVRRIALAVLLIAPPGLMVGGVLLYNQMVNGMPIFSDLGGVNILVHFAPRVLPLDETPEKAFFEELLPEVDPDVLFSTGSDWYTARTRAALDGPDALNDFFAADDALASQVIRDHPGVYALWLLEKTYGWLMVPRREAIPIEWYRPELGSGPPREPYELPTFGCGGQAAVTSELAETICSQRDRVREESLFVPILPALPSMVAAPLHFVTISLPFRIRLVQWIFVWGFVSLPGVFWLAAKHETKSIGLILGAVFAAELIPVILVGGMDLHYHLIFHPIFLLIAWIILGKIGQKTEIR